MNKKLFSWKALAGFALLAAISMTSCTNSDDPIDPLNPNQGKTTPIAIIDGNYDVVLNNIKKTTDVQTAWNNVPAATKAKIDAKDSVDVAINCSEYSLDDVTMSLPAFIANHEKKVVNVYFIGNFASQAVAGVPVPLKIDLDTNLTGAEVNLFFATDPVWVDLTSTKVRASVDGLNEELTRFDVNGNTNAKEFLDIKSGVTVDAINVTGGALTSSSVKQIVTKLIFGNEKIEAGKGAAVGTVADKQVYVKGLTVAADATISNLHNTDMDIVIVGAGTTAVAANFQPSIKELIGLGNAKAPSVFQFAGGNATSQDQLKKIGSVKNITLAGLTTDVKDFSIFENTVFACPVNLIADSVYNTTFTNVVNITATEEDKNNVIFNNVAFSGANDQFDVWSTLNFKYDDIYTNIVVFEKTPKENVATTDSLYTWVKGGVDGVSPSNQKKAPSFYEVNPNWYGWNSDYTSYTRVTTWDQIVTAGITRNAKGLFEFAPWDVAYADYTAKKKAYEARVPLQGTKSLYDEWKNQTVTGGVYEQYRMAFEKLYGPCKDNADASKGQAASFQALYGATNANNTGLNRTYYYELDFVNGANAAMNGCYWLVIRWMVEGATYDVDPNPFIIDFQSCTAGGADMTTRALQKMFGRVNFGSALEAWYYVALEGDVLGWKHLTGSSGTFILWE
jgi:hypothetical protein